MFIIFGTKTIKKLVPNGHSENSYCSNCRSTKRLIEYTLREHFSLFFIPIFPISKKRSVLSCSHCGIDYAFPDKKHGAGESENPPNKKIINAPNVKAN